VFMQIGVTGRLARTRVTRSGERSYILEQRPRSGERSYMNIAIIPARGGSKRIERKNVRDFCGKPMIAWSIETALESALFDQVVVSTDCEEIAQVSRRYGAATPFTRPDDLSDGHTATIPVVRHAIQWLASHEQMPTYVCCLYATAPFATTNDLRRGFERLTTDPELQFAFPVTAFGFPIQRALGIRDDRIEMLQPEFELVRSQDLKPAYHDAGQFYWGTADAFLKQDGFYSARSAPIVLPNHRVQDIDTPEDWIRAELMFRMIQSEGVA